MSGGHFEYKNDTACGVVFDYDLSPVYGLGKSNYYWCVKKAREINPLEDVELSELVYDMFCLLHSFDWYVSGDNCRDIYEHDIAYFRQKWLKQEDQKNE